MGRTMQTSRRNPQKRGKSRPHLSLTVPFKKEIMRFKLGKSITIHGHNTRMLAQLTAHLKRKFPEIIATDVERWIENHPWIKDQSGNPPGSSGQQLLKSVIDELTVSDALEEATTRNLPQKKPTKRIHGAVVYNPNQRVTRESPLSLTMDELSLRTRSPDRNSSGSDYSTEDSGLLESDISGSLSPPDLTPHRLNGTSSVESRSSRNSPPVLSNPHLESPQYRPPTPPSDDDMSSQVDFPEDFPPQVVLPQDIFAPQVELPQDTRPQGGFPQNISAQGDFSQNRPSQVDFPQDFPPLWVPQNLPAQGELPQNRPPQGELPHGELPQNLPPHGALPAFPQNPPQAPLPPFSSAFQQSHAQHQHFEHFDYRPDYMTAGHGQPFGNPGAPQFAQPTAAARMQIEGHQMNQIWELLNYIRVLRNDINVRRKGIQSGPSLHRLMRIYANELMKVVLPEGPREVLLREMGVTREEIIRGPPVTKDEGIELINIADTDDEEEKNSQDKRKA